MKPFRSKLASLLTIRQKQEQAKLEAYAKAMQTREGARASRDAIVRAVEVLRNEVCSAMQHGCSAVVLIQFQGYGARLSEDVRRAEEILKVAEKALAAALEELQVAKRRRETVDKFQQKEQVAYDRELLMEEQKLLDEMALRRVASNLVCSPVKT